MAKKTVITENTEIDEDTAAAGTLHPGAGATSGDQPGSVEPSRFSMISSVMGALANLDKSSLVKYYDEMMSSTTGAALGKNIPDGASAKNKATIHGAGQSGDSSSGTGDLKPGHSVKEEIKKEVADMLGEEEGLTPEFKEKATVLFEAAIEARVAEITSQIQDEHEEILDQEIQEISEAFEEKVATYIEYIAEEWMKENEVAIESSLRSEITTEFMTKLRDLFNECNVNIPEDQVEVVDALATKVDELEARLSEAIQDNAELKQKNEISTRKEIVDDAVQGLTTVDSEKLKKLAEGVDADSPEEFADKVKIIKESVTSTKAPKKSTVETLMEETSDDNKKLVEEETHVDPHMQPYLRALERTTRAS